MPKLMYIESKKVKIKFHLLNIGRAFELGILREEDCTVERKNHLKTEIYVINVHAKLNIYYYSYCISYTIIIPYHYTPHSDYTK